MKNFVQYWPADLSYQVTGILSFLIPRFIWCREMPEAPSKDPAQPLKRKQPLISTPIFHLIFLFAYLLTYYLFFLIKKHFFLNSTEINLFE